MSRATSASAKTEGSIAKGPLQVLTPPPSAQGGAELCAFRPSHWVPGATTRLGLPWSRVRSAQGGLSVGEWLVWAQDR